MIRITDVSKSYGTQKVIDGLSLCINPGEKTALLAPSGCGKTTLLRLIAGLERPDSGRITVSTCKIGKNTGDGQQESDHPASSVLEDDLSDRSSIMTASAYLFQEPRLLRWFTVLENVAAVLNGKNRKEEGKMWLEKCGMGEHLLKYPDELSGGMAQRVVLARALATGRELFLLDEPYKGLDKESQEELIRLTGACLKEKTLLLVTHEYQTAKSLCNRIITFGKGMKILSDERFENAEN